MKIVFCEVVFSSFLFILPYSGELGLTFQSIIQTYRHFDFRKCKIPFYLFNWQSVRILIIGYFIRILDDLKCSPCYWQVWKYNYLSALLINVSLLWMTWEKYDWGPASPFITIQVQSLQSYYSNYLRYKRKLTDQLSWFSWLHK